jgi:predicted dehydrogenase
MRIGIVGCGNISDIYIKNCKRFDVLSLAACADIDAERAKSKAEVYDLPRSCSVDEMLADPEIELILNLTPPQAHAEISLRAIEAGKHVYSEKPLALNRDEGRRLVEAAAARNVRLGCAPDTFMGGALQTARRIIDAGELGRPVSAVAFMLCHGHESWHPNPDFFYQPGGGPVFDMGPYYLSALIGLIGPVRRVAAMSQTTFPERVVTAEARRGEKIAVQTPTHMAAVLEFENDATCSLIMSFDVWSHQLPPIEIYGADGSLSLPDPNNFGGSVRMRLGSGKSWRKLNSTHGYEENSRGVGVADMVSAIQSGRTHRASAELAFHVLDVMQSIYDAAREGRHVDISSRCERPDRMPQGLNFGRVED